MRLFLWLVVVLSTPKFASALTLDDLLSNFNRVILNPTIAFLFVVALLVFFYGMIAFIRNLDSDTERDKGKSHMLWGIIGMAIMVSVFGIIRFILNTLDLSAPAGLP